MDKKFYEDAYLAPSIDVINLSLESSVLLEASDGDVNAGTEPYYELPPQGLFKN